MSSATIEPATALTKRGSRPTSASSAFLDLAPARASLRERILQGLTGAEKEVPENILRTGRSGWLLNRLRRAQWAYPDRPEVAALKRFGPEISRLAGDRDRIVEYGSGPCEGASVLLKYLTRVASYVPVDLSRVQLLRAAERLKARYPLLEILPVRADFTTCFALPVTRRPAKRTLVYLSGATLGRLDASRARAVLQGVAKLCGRHGRLLIGTPRHRQPIRLARAYSDRAGLARALNFSALDSLNRTLSADFHIDAFQHDVRIDGSTGRVEMRLKSVVDQRVKIDGTPVCLAKGEGVRTQCAYSHDYALLYLAPDLASKSATNWRTSA